MLLCCETAPSTTTAVEVEDDESVEEMRPGPPCPECDGPMPIRRTSGGICGKCLNDPAIRQKRGLPCPDFRGRAPLPSRPTNAAPGTEEKIVVLEERARLGMALFHPLDAPMDKEAAELGVAGQSGLRHSYGRVVDTQGLLGVGGMAGASGEDAGLQASADRWTAIG
jgi:hypothetical protein